MWYNVILVRCKHTLFFPTTCTAIFSLKKYAAMQLCKQPSLWFQLLIDVIPRIPAIYQSNHPDIELLKPKRPPFPESFPTTVGSTCPVPEMGRESWTHQQFQSHQKFNSQKEQGQDRISISNWPPIQSKLRHWKFGANLSQNPHHVNRQR